VPDSSVTPNPWFALYVKNRHEKKIASSLEGKGFEAFLPTYPKHHQHSKKFELPLFPGYVFCRLPVGDKLPVVSTPGVFLIVGNGSPGAIVPETEIEGIRRTMESGCMVKPWPYVSRGERIHLRSGPLRGVEGVVMDETHDDWLILSVHLLQRSLAVKVDRSCLT
jgi:transcriptional antiterminator NusG